MLTVEQFVALLKDSGLLEESVWQKWRDQNPSRAESSQELADGLAEAGLLTSWQRDKLLEGKSKGFFLGQYKVLSQLGAGNMGAVYLAEHTIMRRRVALKVMADRYRESTRHVERFEREARATGAVAHPRIVRAYDVCMQGKTPYLVMEYVEGEDLQKIVLRDGVMPVRDAAEYIRQAAEGLHAAHQAGLVHRDVKPSNIMLDTQKQVHILDLGLARLEAGEEASLTMMHNSKALGTVDYLAPEQAVDSHAVDARADIYSLGCTFYFLLAGKPPFDQGSIAQRILAHQTKKPQELRELRPEIPRRLAAICDKMLAKDRKRRFQTAADVAAALSAFLTGAHVSGLDSFTEEEDLLMIDMEEEQAQQPAASKAAANAPGESSAAIAPAAQASATAVSTKSGSGSGSRGGGGSGAGGSGSSPIILPPLQEPSPPDFFSPSGSDALFGALAPSPLQPISPSQAAFGTASDALDATQTMLKPISAPSPLSPLTPLPAGPVGQPLAQAGVRQAPVPQAGMPLRAVPQSTTPAAQQTGSSGGLMHQLWFLILLGIVCGLVVAGIVYGVLVAVL